MNDNHPILIGTKTPAPDLVDPFRVRNRKNGLRVTQPRRKKIRVRGGAHEEASNRAPADIRHVECERRRRIRIATGEWLRPFYD